MKPRKKTILAVLLSLVVAAFLVGSITIERSPPVVHPWRGGVKREVIYDERTGGAVRRPWWSRLAWDIEHLFE